jgi:hypothetical protein
MADTLLDANGVLSESEQTINLKLLGLITIIYLSIQINHKLTRYSHVFKGEHGLCLVLGLLAGCISQSFMPDAEVQNLLYS